MKDWFNLTLEDYLVKCARNNDLEELNGQLRAENQRMRKGIPDKGIIGDSEVGDAFRSPNRSFLSTQLWGEEEVA